jgi:hypothetical protein
MVIAILLVLTGCSQEQTYPYNHAIGLIEVKGTDYQSVLIIHYRSGAIHVVGGFISDTKLPTITVGQDNFQNAPLQIVASQSLIVHNGQKHKIHENGYLIWFLTGQTYHQTLNGFPLEKDIQMPTSVSVPSKTDSD